MLGGGAAMAAEAKFDGNELLMQCQHFIKLIDDEKGFSPVYAGACGGFVQGVDSTVFFYGEDLEKDAKFCTPKNATNAQLVRIVVKYLKDNPKLLNKDKTTLVWLALKDAYPCK
jgi:hypothetical protein